MNPQEHMRTGPSATRGEDTEHTYDVAVVGAGLIGLFTALSMAKRGLSVLLVDDVVHARTSFKVGESFLVSTALARTIGELDDFLSEECFTKLGVWFSHTPAGERGFDSGSEFSIAPLSEYTVDEGPDHPRDHYLYRAAKDPKWFRCLTVDQQLCRPDAERVLQETARAREGLDFVDDARACLLEFGDGDRPHTVGWRRPDADPKAAPHTANARWVVDCSGRNRLLAKRFGHAVDQRETADGFQTTAVWAQFEGVDDTLFGPEWEYHADAGHATRRDLYTLHMWGDGYWIWIIRLSGGRISVGVIHDQRRPRPGATPKEKFFGTIALHPMLDSVLRPENVLEFRTYKNVQYFSDTVVHPSRYAMLGDAESIVDAYYSQGIALSSQHLWHVTNIVARDVREGVLDDRYIDRLNRCALLDWRLLRVLFREKYTPAIADPRFFLLSHLVDLVVLWSTGTARADFASWLTRTEGDPAREGARELRLRTGLERHLYYSGARMWSFLPPEWIPALADRLQRGLARRARWRLEHGERVRAAHCQISLSRPVPRLWPLFRSFSPGRRADDVSSHDYLAPARLRRSGYRRTPLLARLPGGTAAKMTALLHLRTPAVLGALLTACAADAVDTSLRRLRRSLRNRRAAHGALLTDGAE